MVLIELFINCSNALLVSLMNHTLSLTCPLKEPMITLPYPLPLVTRQHSSTVITDTTLKVNAKGYRSIPANGQALQFSQTSPELD